MNKRNLIFVVMFFVVLSLGFASCDNDKGSELDDPVMFTLTLLSSNEAMGTVTGGGTYEKDTEVIIEATATKDACVFVKWSDGNIENSRTLTMTENLTLTAEFDYVYVDLGLSVRWATCNIGANSPEECGDYFAWAETAPKTTYNWGNYKYCEQHGSKMTKYATNDSYSDQPDGVSVLEMIDDAARVNWGETWRIPTNDEMVELIENCTWEWITQNGTSGYKVTSEINNNSIFLPAAGSYDEDGVEGQGEHAYYWTNSIRDFVNNTANALYFLPSYTPTSTGSAPRYQGIPIRPICQ